MYRTSHLVSSATLVLVVLAFCRVSAFQSPAWRLLSSTQRSKTLSPMLSASRRVKTFSPRLFSLKMVATNPIETIPANAPILAKYELVKHDKIDEYGAKVSLFKHKKTGAEVMSVSVPDDNKVFGITFRTPPADSTGVPHILEHSVLCGSRKYPVKEPFVELLKGSMNTFLNAFTYPDRTCYPVASQVCCRGFTLHSP